MRKNWLTPICNLITHFPEDFKLVMALDSRWTLEALVQPLPASWKYRTTMRCNGLISNGVGGLRLV